jgi:protein SCO1/2
MALISFDPRGDTPAALNAYKQKRALDDNWILMTGKKSGIRQLAAVLGVSYKEESPGVFSHANVLSVIDRQGVIVSQINQLNGRTDDMVAKISQLTVLTDH